MDRISEPNGLKVLEFMNTQEPGSYLFTSIGTQFSLCCRGEKESFLYPIRKESVKVLKKIEEDY